MRFVHTFVEAEPSVAGSAYCLAATTFAPSPVHWLAPPRHAHIRAGIKRLTGKDGAAIRPLPTPTALRVFWAFRGNRRRAANVSLPQSIASDATRSPLTRSGDRPKISASETSPTSTSSLAARPATGSALGPANQLSAPEVRPDAGSTRSAQLRWSTETTG